MIIYEKHLLNNIDDPRVIYELITHCRVDDKILCFDINSQKENFDIPNKNLYKL